MSRDELAKRNSLVARLTMWTGAHLAEVSAASSVAGRDASAVGEPIEKAAARSASIDATDIVVPADGRSMASLEIADSIVLPVDAAMVPMRWEGRAAELGDRTGDEIVSEVDEAWHRSKDEIFDVFLLCAELARIYPPKQRKQFVDCLPFDRSTFDKLKKAGRDERLFKIRNLLPPSVSSICLISRFTDDELGAALQSGLIHPGLKRAQLAGWRRARLRPSGTTGSTGVRLYAKIYQPVEELSPVAASELKKALDAIALLPGFRVDFCIMHAFKTNE